MDDEKNFEGKVFKRKNVKKLHFEQTFKIAAISILFSTYDTRKKARSTDLEEELRNFLKLYGAKRGKVKQLLSTNPYPFIETTGQAFQINPDMLKQYGSLEIPPDEQMTERIAKWQEEATPFIEEVEREDTSDLQEAFSLYYQTVIGILDAFYLQLSGNT